MERPPNRAFTFIHIRLFFTPILFDLLSDSIEQDRCNEAIPEQNQTKIEQAPDKVFKVYAERDEVKRFLSLPQFTLHEDAETADILWLNGHFKDFK